LESRSDEHQLRVPLAGSSLLQRIVDKVPGMIAYWDANQTCRFANADYERWFGITPEELIGKTMRELLGPVYHLNLPYILGALRGEQQMFDREFPNPNGGPARYSQTNYVPDIVNGVVKGLIVLVSDISGRRALELQLREAQETARALATHDFLTGLPNRIVLNDRLLLALRASRRQQHKCAVLFLDLDGFKNVNDTLGHAAGDLVLREVSKRIITGLRESDTVARVGGDEFIVLLPEVNNRDQVGLVAQKLLAAMAGNPFEVEGHSLALSFSIGIALFPDNGEEINELIANADRGLYKAKHSGKNQYMYS
jgi:diguanylate cyclase (GGDEF)-like protein/PAS domain S-box-containing protein